MTDRDEGTGISPAEPRLRAELLAMAEEDAQIRSKLLADGSLFKGDYDPHMEQAHRRHAERLEMILAHHGWPGRSLVGSDGAEAAWLILQHAIAIPELQRSALPLLRRAVAEREAEPLHVAYLEDRIAFFEGRPQRYGTHFDWDAGGELSPHPIADADQVDVRRAEVGLPPLAEQIKSMRQRSAAEGEAPP
ncbi:MAG: DUF6624 domain-containing protein, partial [Acidobacteriota bacterium]